MNSSDFVLQKLEERDAQLNLGSDWTKCVQISSQIIEEETRFKELSDEISRTKAIVDPIEDKLMENKVFADLLPCITKLRENNNELRKEMEALQECLPQFEEKVYNLLITHRHCDVLDQKYQQEYEFYERKIQQLQDDSLAVIKEKENIVSQLILVNEKYDKLSLESSELAYESDLLEERKEYVAPVQGKSSSQRSKCDAPIPEIQKRSNSTSSLTSSNFDFRSSIGINRDHRESSNDNIIDFSLGSNAVRYHAQAVTCLTFSSGYYCVSGSEDSQVIVMNASSLSKMYELDHSNGSITSISFSPTQSRFITSSFDKSINLYQVTSSFRLQTHLLDNKDIVTVARFSTEDKYLTCCRDGNIKLFDVNRSFPIQTCNFGSTASDIYPVSGESVIITGHKDGRLVKWDMRMSNKKALVVQMPVHKAEIYQLFVTNDNEISTFSQDRTINCTDIRSFKLVSSYSLRNTRTACARQIGIYENTAIIGGDDGSLNYIDLENKCVKKTRPNCHSCPITIVAASNNGYIASGDRTGAVMIWKM